MKRYERLNTLLETLAEKGSIDVDDLAEQLQVSAATIRRDLDHLGRQQLLTRTRGGAVANAVSYDLPLRYKSARFASEKQRIAQAASTLVRRGMVIGMNGGTTISEVARTLATRPELSAEHGEPAFTLVTNALNIANELIVRPHVKMVLTGGVARPQSYEMIGPLSHRILAAGRRRGADAVHRGGDRGHQGVNRPRVDSLGHPLSDKTSLTRSYLLSARSL